MTIPATSPTSTSPPNGDVLVRVTNLVKHFPLQSSSLLRRAGQREFVHAVEDVSLEIRRGETLGLVGETGCGKSTLARCVTRLLDPTSGTIEFEGQDVTRLKRAALKPFRREVQMIFQDPFGSLNPRRRVGSIIADPLVIHGMGDGSKGKDRKALVQETMEHVGLNPEHYNRFPSEFSGGQRQRIGVARALILRPKLIVCDEPVSALDVSIQAQIINLLSDLQKEFGLTYLFIAHDLSVVRHVSERVAVMYLGSVIEEAPSRELYNRSRHPYARALLSAVPIPDPASAHTRQRIILTGDVPSPISPPSGCRFHPRCPKSDGARCVVEPPVLIPRLDDPPAHRAACHYPVREGEVLVSAVPSAALAAPEEYPAGGAV
ncbi:MAG: putative peptide transporter ATP-binding protein [Frankiales bacterium]|nr:putative peptide transporter ATP-binding protein [Frankiales bacterium]